MISLKDKVIWLTGASSGIGEALAFELGRRGAILALSARNREALERISSDLTKSGARVLVAPCDVLDIEQTKATANLVTKTLGTIDIVIANAGTHIFSVPEKFDSAEYLGLMQLNYGGLLHTIESVVPAMIARRGGYIVGVASMAGYRALPRAAAYGASKAAAIHFLESLRFHLAEHGIAVSIVNPGFVKTPLTDKNDFRMPFLIDAREAAATICDGMERQKLEIAFPSVFKWIMKISQLLPDFIYRPIVRSIWKSM
ncbi:MAG: SDR family NAD(P)-dependent oxidoreductase [Deltaproteobacteria bacterium]|nr:SDR family NAD(P)-dependent oxidoreductase [Deltaproteobacteria bacterium]